MVGIGEDERNDQCIGDDRRNCAEIAVAAKRIGPQGTEQSCQCAEDDIRQYAAGDQVADQAATARPGTAAGVKKGRMVRASEKRT